MHGGRRQNPAATRFDTDTFVAYDTDLPSDTPNSRLPPKGLPARTRKHTPTHAVPSKPYTVTEWIQEVAAELGQTVQQIAHLSHVYFDVMGGVGGRNALWNEASQPRTLDSSGDAPRARGDGWGPATNPFYSTQAQTYVFHASMRPSQDFNQKAFQQTRASKKLPSAMKPHAIYQFDAGALNAVRSGGYSHIVVVIDTWSRFIRAFKIKTRKRADSASSRAQTAVKGVHVAAALQDVFDEIITDFGNGREFPQSALYMSDGGPENDNTEVRDIFALYNGRSSKKARHRLTKAHTPTQNAFAETAIKLVKSGIAQWIASNTKNWAPSFDDIVATLNKRRPRVLGVSPADADHLDPRIPADRAQIQLINDRIAGKGIRKRKPYVYKERTRTLAIGTTVRIKNPDAVKSTLRQKFVPLWKAEIYTIVKHTRQSVPTDPVKYHIESDTGTTLPFTWAREDLQVIDTNRQFAPPPERVEEIEYSFHIVNHRTGTGGARMYKARYDGYSSAGDRWIPAAQVDASLVDEYTHRRAALSQPITP